MLVDYDGRVLAQADPGPGEKIVVGPIDLAALRAERAGRRGHHMLAHLRTEAYAGYGRAIYPGSLLGGAKRLSLAGNEEAIARGKVNFQKGLLRS